MLKRRKDLSLSQQKFQQKIVKTIKKHKTIKVLHIFRKYSALAVVIVSAFMVSANNVHSDRNDAQLLPYELEDSLPAKNSFNDAKQENIAFVSFAKADVTSELTKKEKKSEEEVQDANQDQLLLQENSSSFSYLSGQSIIATAEAMEKDPEEEGGVTLYEVKTGDTISQIATDHGVTANTLLWANNIDNINSIMPGDQIFILPVAGLKHVVKKGDTLEDIAKEYEASEEKILSFNELPANGKVKEGQEIIIPGGKKEVPQPATTNSLIAKKQYVTGGGTKTVSKRHDKPNRFPYGYCTWYVAQKKYVPWRGNAGAWLYNAKAMGYKTGSKPKKGSIVVTTDNTYYGHVALVEKVGKDTITISEMNYKGWGIANTRTVSKSDRKIRGYIY